ncbi:MAG: RHS repeat-associated core domain-containing protein, partial [Candidatus Kapabacteria bacterium]|nr:RHS repeat-associated core domain-containing protein [Candidatus Kapabacteria bacterium]
PGHSQQSITYSYDPLYRLRRADYSDGRYFAYTYDAVGNRLTQATLTTTTVYTYDAANRLINVNGVAYTWDANGNLLLDGVSTYTYDAANRLTSVTQGTNTYTFAYNGLNDRLRQTVNGNTTTYVLDLNAGLTQVLADGTNTYLYGHGRVGELQPGGWQYHLPDALGSVRQLANAGGAVTLARSYEPYGTVLTSAGTGTTNYNFTGEWRDVTGLIHLRARYYGPQWGRFLTADSWDGDYERPLTLNKWNYTNGNPINYTDPSGQTPCSMLGGEDREDCEYLPINNRGLLPPKTKDYNEKSLPRNIHWDPWINVPPAKILNYLKQEVPPGTNQSQFRITDPLGVEVTGACGTTSLAAILQDPTLTANDVFLAAYNVQYPVHLQGKYHIVNANPNYTSPDELAWIIRSHRGWNAHVVRNIPASEASSILRLALSANQYPIPGVAIGGISGKVGAGTSGHWLVVTGLSREWLWGNRWQWVRVYNPFDNQEEYYWWKDFLAAWPGPGLDFTQRLMVVAYRSQ